MTRSLTAGLIVVTLAAGVAGCGDDDDSGGGGSDEGQVRAAVTGYFDGLASGDGEAACANLTGDRVRALAESISEQLPELNVTNCQDAISALTKQLGTDELDRLKDLDITVTVTGDTATAQIKGATKTARLRRAGDRWLISGGLP